MKNSYLTAGVILLVVVLWMLSGLLRDDAAPAAAAKVSAQASAGLTQVRVKTFHAEPVTREVVFSGHSAPLRSVDLRAETIGTVASLPVPRGAPVHKGEVLITLAEDNRGARLREAQALVQQRQLELSATRKLQAGSLISEVQLAQAETALKSAQAALGAAELDLARSVIRAPFDGVLDLRGVEVGASVREGDVVARVVDLDPLLIVGTVAEQDVGKLHLGDGGRAHLVTGEELSGRIRYIAAAADTATRTFSVELEVPNPQALPVAGVTAEVRVALEPLSAHHVSPALLALDDGGAVGVKSVGADGTVAFHPANIVRSGNDGLWLAGLPESVRLITVGQGFVNAGEKVQASEE
jgi:multidrug efflux system membrane fusion protein